MDSRQESQSLGAAMHSTLSLLTIGTWLRACFLVCVLSLSISFNNVATAQETNSTQDEIAEETDDAYTGNFTLEDGEELPRSASSQSYHKQINSVLANDEFSQQKTVTQWRWIDTKDKQKRQEKFPETIIQFFEFLERNASTIEIIAKVLEVLLWLSLGLLIVWLLLRYREVITSFVSGTAKLPQEPLPTTLLGLDVKQDSLPKDISATAQSLWQQGQQRQAIALLLRASLVRLIHDYRVTLFDSDTENECCQRIDDQAPQSNSRYMRMLVNAWQAIAYAHRAPDESLFMQLCNEWSEVFDAK